MAKQYLKWYENHKAAFLAGKFDYDSLSSFSSVTDVVKALESGLTIEPLWTQLVRELSITSQLLMSRETFKHITKSAESSIKKGFKHYQQNVWEHLAADQYSLQTNA